MATSQPSVLRKRKMVPRVPADEGSELLSTSPPSPSYTTGGDPRDMTRDLHPDPNFAMLSPDGSTVAMETSPIANYGQNGQIRSTLLNLHGDPADADIFQETSLTAPLLPLQSSEDEDEEVLLQRDDVVIENELKVIQEPDEASWQIALQVFFPYIIAGFGMVGAGIVLDIVQVSDFQWPGLNLHGCLIH